MIIIIQTNAIKIGILTSRPEPYSLSGSLSCRFARQTPTTALGLKLKPSNQLPLILIIRRHNAVVRVGGATLASTIFSDAATSSHRASQTPPKLLPNPRASQTLPKLVLSCQCCLGSPPIPGHRCSQWSSIICRSST